jgi:hypothetical protein
MKIKDLIEVLQIIENANPNAKIYSGRDDHYDIDYYNFSDPLYDKLPPYKITSDDKKRLKQLGVNYKSENGLVSWEGEF